MGRVFIICGSPGAGKSVYGRDLAQKMEAVLLDIDTVTERLVRLALAESGQDPDDRDSAYFKNTFRQPIYDTLFDIARQNLSRLNVVIVGPFTREIRKPDWPSELSRILGAPAEVHYVYCRPEIRRERLVKRNNPRDMMKLQDWNDHLKYYGEEKPPEFAHVFVDTSKAF